MKTQGILSLNTWAGFREYSIFVLAKNKAKCYVELAEDVNLPGNRLKKAGDKVWVPKYAVRLVERGNQNEKNV